MFRYSIYGNRPDTAKPKLIALTDYEDIASYIEAHAVEALDPTGESGLTISVVETPPATFANSFKQGADK